MLIKYNGEGVKPSKLDDAYVEICKSPKPWQFPTIANAANMGFEIIWEYDDVHVDKQGDCDSDKHKKLSSEFFSLRLDLKIKTQKNYNILIVPHYSLYTCLNNNNPIAAMQTIETDWYPNNIELIFAINPAGSLFKKGKPIAQGFCIPRREYTTSEMSRNEIKQNEKACKFIEDNKDKYITRTETFDDYADKNNLYENLSNLAIRNSLPEELKEKKPPLGSRRRLI